MGRRRKKYILFLDNSRYDLDLSGGMEFYTKREMLASIPDGYGNLQLDDGSDPYNQYYSVEKVDYNEDEDDEDDDDENEDDNIFNDDEDDNYYDENDDDDDEDEDEKQGPWDYIENLFK